MRFKNSLIFNAFAAFIVVACGWSASNTGIFPGNPEENFAPLLVPAGREYRNLALNRAALQSSAIDLEQTAQLATDGLMLNEAPFRSAWKSESGRNEWIEVDLGGQARLDKAVFNWINELSLP